MSLTPRRRVPSAAARARRGGITPRRSLVLPADSSFVSASSGGPESAVRTRRTSSSPCRRGQSRRGGAFATPIQRTGADSRTDAGCGCMRRRSRRSEVGSVWPEVCANGAEAVADRPPPRDRAELGSRLSERGPERGPDSADVTRPRLHSTVRICLYRAKSDASGTTLNPKVPGSILGGGNTPIATELTGRPSLQRSGPGASGRASAAATSSPRRAASSSRARARAG
jgi:hypothetical protein